MSFFEDDELTRSDASEFDTKPPFDAKPDSVVDAEAVGRLLHRYDFGGTGDVVFDRVGSAHGLALGGAALDGSGMLRLDGIDDYVDLPNRLISRLAGTTLVAWMTWYGGNCWHRVFDFGSTLEGEGIVGTGMSNVLVTPRDCPGPGPNAIFGIVRDGGETESSLRSPIPFGAQVERQVALAIDGVALRMELYVDGESRGNVALPFGLEAIDDVNNWLGRSQWRQDFNLPGAYNEFRIYDGALSSQAVAALYALGPDVIR